MSVAKALNLAIALTEDKPAVARSISRTLPLEDMKGITTASSRLLGAVQEREMKAVYAELLEIQKFSMVLEPGDEWSPERTQAWFEGISTVELWIDRRINDLRRLLKMDDGE